MFVFQLSCFKREVSVLFWLSCPNEHSSVRLRCIWADDVFHSPLSAMRFWEDAISNHREVVAHQEWRWRCRKLRKKKLEKLMNKNAADAFTHGQHVFLSRSHICACIYACTMTFVCTCKISYKCCDTYYRARERPRKYDLQNSNRTPARQCLFAATTIMAHMT